MAEYIERDAALEYAAQKIKEGEVEMAICDKTDLDFCTGRTCGYMVMKNFFDILPAADVAPVRHGRWEAREDAFGFARCSACKDCNIYDDWVDGKKWSYCPNCGATMDLEVNDG